MKTLAALMILAILAGCAAGHGPEAANGDVGASPPIRVAVAIDTKGKSLGAYQLVVQYQPSEARIRSITALQRGAVISEFPGAPIHDPGSFESGSTRIFGYNPGAATPQGPYAVCSIEFERVGGPRSPLQVIVEGLFDSSAPPKRLEDSAIVLSRYDLDFTRPD